MNGTVRACINDIHEELSVQAEEARRAGNRVYASKIATALAYLLLIECTLLELRAMYPEGEENE